MKKQKQKKPDGRCATCPRWDRWHIRIPNSEDQQKLIRLYRKSGAKTKSDFVRARLLGESFKVITQDPAKEPYLEKLSEIVALAHKIGVLYNEVVKVLNYLSFCCHMLNNCSANSKPIPKFSSDYKHASSTTDKILWE